MKVIMRALLWALVGCLGLWHTVVFAQSSDDTQSLLACNRGWEACDRSKLTQSESVALTLTDHARNVSNCRDGSESCDHSKLSDREKVALAIADHERTFSACKDGSVCDSSRLTPSEAR